MTQNCIKEERDMTLPPTIGVTGAAGFIGANLVERLLDEGCTVIGVDDMSMGTLRNLAGLLDNPNFRFAEFDCRDYPAYPPFYWSPAGFVASNVVSFAAGGYLMFLHGFQQRCLRLWRRAIDLVGEDDLREHGALDEAQRPAAALVVEDLGARDVGRHQVRGELDALEAQVQNLGQRLDQ